MQSLLTDTTASLRHAYSFHSCPGGPAIQERADLYFGHDDYLLWPQPYHPDSLPHLPFIHWRELDLADLSRAFLWLLPDKCQFTLCDLSACTGLGKLLISYLEVFLCFWLVLKSCTTPLGIDSSSLMLELIRQVEPLLDRLQFIATGFNMTCRTVHSLQRTLLKIEAFLKCKTRLNMADNVPSCSSPTPSIIGASGRPGDTLSFRCSALVHLVLRRYSQLMGRRGFFPEPLWSWDIHGTQLSIPTHSHAAQIRCGPLHSYLQFWK